MSTEATTATPAASSGESQGPLSAEEQAQFDAMREAPAAPTTAPEAPAAAPATAPGTAPAAKAPATPGAAPATAAEGDDDEDDDAAAQAGQPGQPGEKPPKRVSFHKYQRETKKLQDQVADLSKKLEDGTITRAKMEERLALINEALMTPAQQKKAEEEDPRPDPEADIFGYVAWQDRQRAKLEARLEEMSTGSQARDEESTLQTSFMEDAQAFAQAEPNFIPAYNFLMQNRGAELAQYFFGKNLYDPNETPLTAQQLARIKNSILAEERDLVREAIGAGESPAKRVMALALGRGYRKMTAEEMAAARAGGNGAAQPAPATAATTNGTAQPAIASSALNGGAKPAAAPNVTDEIARIKAGSEAARSLSDGGAAPNSPLTPERLAKMGDDEFGDLLESLSSTQLRSVLGN